MYVAGATFVPRDSSRDRKASVLTPHGHATRHTPSKEISKTIHLPSICTGAANRMKLIQAKNDRRYVVFSDSSSGRHLAILDPKAKL